MEEKVYELFDWKAVSPAPVIGVDEVGRGCLAGPVFAAAVCFKSDQHIELLTDSKLLSEDRREMIAPLIHTSHWVSIASASVEEIEKLNIFYASLLAMRRAVTRLCKDMAVSEGHVLVDGKFPIPRLKLKQTPLIKGDLRAAPISAASIVAKVARDRLMKELGKEFPAYGFENHKGYATPPHKKIIKKIGPTVWHRKTFEGVKEYITGD